ncbi:MAG: hypothetical protein RLZZ436_1228 [Planctomycetota bacterium]
MYQSHFELHRPLFQGSDRTRLFFRSESIRAVQPHLLRVLRGSLGPCLLTARQGSGRTTLLRQLQKDLEHDGRTVVVSGAALDSLTALLQLLLHCALRPAMSGGSGTAAEKVELTHWSVMQQLQKSLDFWGPVFLLLDDAHLVKPEILNELRALSEEEWQGRGVVRILVSAPLSFEMDLGRSEYASFAQRICCHEVLEPLTVVESLELLRMEIEAAGGRAEQVFTEPGAALLASASEGLPRQLSLLSNETLAVAAEQGIGPADEDCVRLALKRLQHLPLSWNLPAQLFAEDVPDTGSEASGPLFELLEGVRPSGAVFGPGVVEIGGPSAAEPSGIIEYSSPHIDVPESVTAACLPGDTQVPEEFEPQPAIPAAEVWEPLAASWGLQESRSFWDPEHADFSSALPVPERSSGPLNYGLISGDSDWNSADALLGSASTARGPEIPQLRLADEDVLISNPHSQAILQPVFQAPPVAVPAPEPAPPLPLTAIGRLPESDREDTEIDLFRAFSGRRLTTAVGVLAEHRAGLTAEEPVSLPLWRDGSLLRQSTTAAERVVEQPVKPSAGSVQAGVAATGLQAPGSESDEAAASESRFTTLFTRLRRLQAGVDPLNAEQE